MVENSMEELIRQHLESIFPGLVGSNYHITSRADSNYNCIAWAAGDTAQRWWPVAENYWPCGAREDDSIYAFVSAFELRGYEIALNFDLEPSVEKIAIYMKNQKPTHAARQLKDGTWTSKLGDFEDIIHSNLSDISGEAYGFPYIAMWRER